MQEKSKIQLSDKIKAITKILLGCFLVFKGIESFATLVKLHEYNMNWSGCFPQERGFPFFEVMTSVFLILYGLILIKKFDVLFRVLIFCCFAIATFKVLRLSFIFYDSIINNYSITTGYKILEIGGFIFFSLLIAEYYHFDWKNEIKKLGVLKIAISVIMILILTTILNKI